MFLFHFVLVYNNFLLHLLYMNRKLLYIRLLSIHPEVYTVLCFLNT